MADDKPIRRKGLAPDRWAALVAYFADLRFDMSGAFDPMAQIKLDVPIEIDGVTFLPAVYFPA